MNAQKPLLQAARDDFNAVLLKYKSDMWAMQRKLGVDLVGGLTHVASIYTQAAASPESAKEVRDLLVATLLHEVGGDDADTPLMVLAWAMLYSTFDERE